MSVGPELGTVSPFDTNCRWLIELLFIAKCDLHLIIFYNYYPDCRVSTLLVSISIASYENILFTIQSFLHQQAVGIEAVEYAQFAEYVHPICPYAHQTEPKPMDVFKESSQLIETLLMTGKKAKRLSHNVACRTKSHIFVAYWLIRILQAFRQQ